MTRFGLIGEHLSHSYSPEIHAMLSSVPYECIELAPEALGAFLRAREFDGLNVTIPYKTAVLPYLDEIDGVARQIGAVNTIVRRGGRLIGYNTDFDGLCAMIKRAELSLQGKKVLILGSGGTSSTARAVAAHLGAASIITVGRTARRGVLSYEDAYSLHADADILINTTPCGMAPHEDGADGIAACPVSLDRFSRLSGVLDVVYHPLRTNLVVEASSRAIPACGGLFMLVAQAVLSSARFLGLDTCAPIEPIFRKIKASKENIVLVGMPGAGKTTVGRLLAARLHRSFFDSDEEIVKRTGQSIPSLFAARGEAAFRATEREILRELAREKEGAVLATGGGAVLSPENIRALRRTGKIFFLDRQTECLTPTADRPIADTSAKMRALYASRAPLYRTSCDERIPNDGTPEQAAEAILTAFDALASSPV